MAFKLTNNVNDWSIRRLPTLSIDVGEWELELKLECEWNCELDDDEDDDDD